MACRLCWLDRPLSYRLSYRVCKIGDCIHRTYTRLAFDNRFDSTARILAINHSIVVVFAGACVVVEHFARRAIVRDAGFHLFLGSATTSRRRATCSTGAAINASAGPSRPSARARQRRSDSLGAPSPGSKSVGAGARRAAQGNHQRGPSKRPAFRTPRVQESGETCDEAG